MCAPCKVILDAAAAAYFEGEDVEAAMARACTTQVDKFPTPVQDKMIQLDEWLLRQPDRELARKPWRNRLMGILDDFANGAVLAYQEREEP